MASPTPPLLLVRFHVFSPTSSLHSPSRPRWRPQQLEDLQRRGTAQVLPGLLSRCVPQLDVRVELVNQQPHHVSVAVDGGNMERRVAAC